MMEPENGIRLSIIVPLWNEAGNIDDLVDMLASLNIVREGECEAVLVNNGSTDHTGDLLNSWSQKYPDWIKAVHLPENLNYGGGIYEGCRHARGKVICYVPGDLQYLGDDLNKIIVRVLDCDSAGKCNVLVKGNRTTRMDAGNFQFVSNVYTKIASLVLGLRVTDVNGLPKAFDRSLLDLLPNTLLKTFVFDAQLLFTARRNGWDIEELDVTFHARRAGISSWSGRRLKVYLRSLVDLWVVRHAAREEPVPLLPKK